VGARGGRAPGLGNGALLLAVYALGLGIPFLVVGLGFGRLSGALKWLRRHLQVLSMSSAVVLGAFGVLLILNEYSIVISLFERALKDVGLGVFVTAG
jgi:cytochrome c biogenesis protein CcdA